MAEVILLDANGLILLIGLITYLVTTDRVKMTSLWFVCIVNLTMDKL